VLAVTDHCARCHRPLAADHVLRAGVRHCYGCDLQLLKEQDLRAAAARPARRRRGRSARPAVLSRPDLPVDAIAARRPGPRPARRRRAA
jgi:hypothetical protein